MNASESSVEWTKVDTARVDQQVEKGLSARPRPFLRWAGSKRFALEEIASQLPRRFRRYYEPFLGGGSLFFLLQPKHAALSDACHDLIATYTAVGQNSQSVARYLRRWRPDKDLYYRLRANPSRGAYRRAAEFIYLNKTCWNGLYRVNSRGRFNVPYGMPKTDTLVDFASLHACARALQPATVSLQTSDFEESLDPAGPGDLAYLDPPYVTGHQNNGFVDYNERLFSWDDQVRLAALADALRRRGVFVIVTNADHDAVRKLYTGFDKLVLRRYQTLANSVSKRRRTTELLLVPSE